MGKEILIGLTLAASVCAARLYGRYAERLGIVATPNFRTLHASPVPRGGGVTSALVFTAAIVVLWSTGGLSTERMLAFGVGGGLAATVGFLDDVFDLRAIVKLCSQIGLSAWLFATLHQTVVLPMVQDRDVVVASVITLVMLFVPVWMVNLFNFTDGIDGMAIGGAVFVCAAVLVILLLNGSDNALVHVVLLLAVASVGFATVNLPPASVFMGDAGSIFLGYVTSALLIMTVASGEIGIWTWLCILSYYVADTTTTTLTRLVLVKKWYGVHRSHAYQNLARILSSHAKVTYGVVLHNLIWALPLALWSASSPAWGPVAAALALAPGVLWTFRFGPRLSSS